MRAGAAIEVVFGSTIAENFHSGSEFHEFFLYIERCHPPINQKMNFTNDHQIFTSNREPASILAAALNFNLLRGTCVLVLSCGQAIFVGVTWK